MNCAVKLANFEEHDVDWLKVLLHEWKPTKLVIFRERVSRVKAGMSLMESTSSPIDPVLLQEET